MDLYSEVKRLRDDSDDVMRRVVALELPDIDYAPGELTAEFEGRLEKLEAAIARIDALLNGSGNKPAKPDNGGDANINWADGRAVVDAVPGKPPITTQPVALPAREWADDDSLTDTRIGADPRDGR